MKVAFLLQKGSDSSHRTQVRIPKSHSVEILVREESKVAEMTGEEEECP
jgi:hypothetical protein